MQPKNTIPNPLGTPVLFLIFNRPDTTQKVFEAIRSVKPTRLYVASDGARPEKVGEAEIIENVRQIATNVDWKCEVKTLFRDKNLGCGKAVSGAITWFFENEPEGIILEDDCLPSQSFFWFCEELLEYYREDPRIWHIGGYRHSKMPPSHYSYHFSSYNSIWGWASWRRAWKHYDFSLKRYRQLKEEILDYNLFPSLKETLQRKKVWDQIILNQLDTWDYQWEFCVRLNSGMAIVPSINLVENIGFGENATHTHKGVSNSVSHEMNFPLSLPQVVLPHAHFDRYFFKEHVDQSLWRRILKKASKLLSFFMHQIPPKHRENHP